MLYLQSDYNGTFTIAAKNEFKDELFPYDYVAIMSNIPKDMTFAQLNALVVEKYGCKKLILQI